MARKKGPSLSPQDVVIAAIKVLASDGLDAMGITRVAQALQIKPASMYNHIASAEALAKAVALEGNRQILTELKAAVRDISDPREQLRKLAFAMRRWAKTNQNLYEHMARVEPDHTDADVLAVITELLSLFDQPLKALDIADNERVHAMRAIRSSLHGFIILEATGQFQLQEAADDSFRWVVERLVVGQVD